jgi:hypothetical protein
LQAIPYFENRLLARISETPVIKSDFPSENVGTGKTCFYYRGLRTNFHLIFLLQIPSKVENILEGSLDLIPSPSPSDKIQIMGGKVCFQKFVDNTKQCFALLPQVNFPANNLNFH